eukprot:COSAG02_NODE_56683_length_284_cov_0.837838_1_plen_59_part_01
MRDFECALQLLRLRRHTGTGTGTRVRDSLLNNSGAHNLGTGGLTDAPGAHWLREENRAR